MTARGAVGCQRARGRRAVTLAESAIHHLPLLMFSGAVKAVALFLWIPACGKNDGAEDGYDN